MSRAKKYLIGFALEFLTLMVVLAAMTPQANVFELDIKPWPNSVDRRPNIVLITMDDMRADELQYMPNVRALISHEGFRFTRAYSTLPQCCPARASLLTGQYAHNHGVMSNYFRFGGGYKQFQRAVDSDDTLGVLLQQAGYRTSYIGKFLNGYASGGHNPPPPGWDTWSVPVGTNIYSYDKQTFSVNGRQQISDEHNTRVVTRMAVEDMRAGQRFFVWLNYLAPHNGHSGTRFGEPKPLRRDRYVPVDARVIIEERDLTDKPSHVKNFGGLDDDDRDLVARVHTGRVRSIIGVDRKIGFIMNHLESNELLDDTVVIFHSDNGYLMGEHGIRSGKNVPYEPATKVPLVMTGPQVPAGSSSVMVTLQDVTATILELAGVRPRHSLDGVSLLRVIERERSFRDRPILYEAGPSFSNSGLGVRIASGRRFFTAIHYRQWVYIRYFDDQQELYDLSRDPNQLQSLHERPEYLSVIVALREELRRLQDCRGDGCNRRFTFSG